MKFTRVTRLSFSEYSRTDRRDLDDDASPTSGEEFRRRYYAFTSLAYDGRTRRLFCGLTNFGNDLLYALDPDSGRFESLGYPTIAEKYEIKIHRGLCLGEDGAIVGATSCLHGIPELAKGPGGKIFRYDPAGRRYEVLGVPIGQLYIQTISLDLSRQMVYGMAYPVFEFFAFSLARRRVVYRQYMGSIAHIGCVDDAGGYWGTWLEGRDRHNLFRYEPSSNEVTFFPHGFPTPCRSLMYHLAGPIDSMVNAGDGRLYVGHESGELYRIEWRSGQVEYLCKPLPGQRLPGLSLGPDGRLFGVGGSDGQTFGFAWDRATGQAQVLGEIRDADGQACFRTHGAVYRGND